MDDAVWARHRRIWGILYPLLHRWLVRKFRITHADLQADGPCLIVSNHVTVWDPLLVALSLRHHQAYFVASEHIFRLGLVTKLLLWLVEPIPRPKAASGLQTVQDCLRYLRSGRSVVLFAEGEQTWDGRTAPFFPATGKLAKRSGASLVTFRIEGGFHTLPRWGKHIQRGAMHAAPVHIYSPEDLQAMSADQVNAAIAADIREDARERQRLRPVRYVGKAPAEGMPAALFLCPGCKKIGTLRARGDRIFCSCGFGRRYTPEGLFDPPEPFEAFPDWDAWQHEALKERDFLHEGALLFADPNVTLTRLGKDHAQEVAGEGPLQAFEERLVCAGRVFPWNTIKNMAIVRTSYLLFQSEGCYWQVRLTSGASLRKYLAIWREK